MNPEDKVLFACTRQNFQKTHQHVVYDLCRRYEINWETVYHTANLHGVAPLVYVNLKQHAEQKVGIPPKIMHQFRQRLMHNISNKEHLATSLARALSFFNERNIKVMVIKGGALDLLVYDHPYSTILHDIDVVISIRREALTDQEVRQLLDFFHGSGLEYDFFEHHDVTMNGVLPVDFSQIWQDAVKISFGEEELWVMSPEDMLISTCINSCRKRFFRLKSLCDLAEIVTRYPDLDWIELVKKARAYDCQMIVFTALLVTTMTVGCQLPEGLLEDLKVNPVQAKIVDYFSRHMSLATFSSLYSDDKTGRRRIDLSLLPIYASLRWYQVWRRIQFVALFADGGRRRKFT